MQIEIKIQVGIHDSRIIERQINWLLRISKTVHQVKVVRSSRRKVKRHASVPHAEVIIRQVKKGSLIFHLQWVLL